MSLELARRIARAVNVRNETAIRSIDQALQAYVRLTRQSETTEITGTIDADQVASGEFADARISETSVTQHEAALELDAAQLSSGVLAAQRLPATVALLDATTWLLLKALSLVPGETLIIGATADHTVSLRGAADGAAFQINAGTQEALIRAGGVAGGNTRVTVRDSEIQLHRPLRLLSRASGPVSAAGSGWLWVKNTSPCELWFTDDAGNETQLV